MKFLGDILEKEYPFFRKIGYWGEEEWLTERCVELFQHSQGESADSIAASVYGCRRAGEID